MKAQSGVQQTLATPIPLPGMETVAPLGQSPQRPTCPACRRPVDSAVLADTNGKVTWVVMGRHNIPQTDTMCAGTFRMVHLGVSPLPQP